jgi:hypothetical protein
MITFPFLIARTSLLLSLGSLPNDVVGSSAWLIGQISTQTPHPVHLSSSICIPVLDAFSSGESTCLNSSSCFEKRGSNRGVHASAFFSPLCSLYTKAIQLASPHFPQFSLGSNLYNSRGLTKFAPHAQPSYANRQGFNEHT